jgi:glycolate oxidase FAD binding subunit
MNALTPQTAEELAEALGAAAAAGKAITLGGGFTKQNMAGPIAPAEVTISTASMRRVLEYAPDDLTISVEAGLPFAELRRVTAQNRLMIPLDPPFSEEGSVGGVVAANLSGPRRCLYGTARNMVIGMKFATLAGKLVQSGGRVVKNVAGLDLAKLMIGSFGTLAAIAVVNFKLVPMPAFSRSFVLGLESLEEAMRARNGVLKSFLQPAALDLLNPRAAAQIGREGYLVVVQAGGNPAVIERYSRELSAAQAIQGDEEEALWHRIQNFTPQFLAGNPDGAAVRVSGTLAQLEAVVESMDAPVVARAGTGVCYGYFANCAEADAWMKEVCLPQGWKAVIEFSPSAEKEKLELWPGPGNDLETMKRVKQMFDPNHLLNRGRLYGRI